MSTPGPCDECGFDHDECEARETAGNGRCCEVCIHPPQLGTA